MSRISNDRLACLLGCAVLVLSLAVPALADDPQDCEADHVVQSGEWLARIAAEQYGDWTLYPALVWATNAQAAAGVGYATITDPWLIQPGWKLCLPSAEAARGALSVSTLQNAEYASDWTASKKALLVNGQYEEAAAPGSASKIVVQLGERMAFGYADGGKPAAIVTLITSGGGSGTFYELAAVLDDGGKPVSTARTLLGDRIKLQSLAFKGEEIVVDMVNQGPDDPMCCPTQRVVRRYALEADGFKLLSEQVVGAQQPPAAVSALLQGTLWKLDTYHNSSGEQAAVLPDTEITLELQDGQVGGSAGCNHYFAAYQLAGDQLTLGPVASTEMACSQDIDMQEVQYLGALAQVVSYRISGEQLQLLNQAGSTLLTFSVLNPAPLTGTAWQVEGFNNGQGGFVSLLAGTELTALFADGLVAGMAGCNQYNASYTVDGTQITFGPAATTRMFCAEPQGVMEQESAFLAALTSAVRFEIKGDVLTLSNGDGARMATLHAPATWRVTAALVQK